VPDELAPKLAGAIKNGRRLQQLINEAGIRYTEALKQERARKLAKRFAVKA
jgi:tRNA U54 and U55 pseudouridine synthase Pus10